MYSQGYQKYLYDFSKTFILPPSLPSVLPSLSLSYTKIRLGLGSKFMLLINLDHLGVSFWRVKLGRIVVLNKGSSRKSSMTDQWYMTWERKLESLWNLTAALNWIISKYFPTKKSYQQFFWDPLKLRNTSSHHASRSTLFFSQKHFKYDVYSSATRRISR